MTSKTTTRAQQLALGFGLAALSSMQALYATELANAPLSNATTGTKHNLLFILDDSGSMRSAHMPDEASVSSSRATQYLGYYSAHCNGLAYKYSDGTSSPVKPYNYTPPPTPAAPVSPATVVQYPAMSFRAALDDGYQPKSNTANAPGLISSTTLSMDVSATDTSKTLTITSSFGTAKTSSIRDDIKKYALDQEVYLLSYDADSGSTAGSPAHWMKGKVTALGNSTVSVNVTFSTVDANQSYSRWVVALPQTTDLSSLYFYKYTGSQKDMAWKYDRSTGALVSDTFAQECRATTSTVLTKVEASSLSDEEKVNYANWYSYYRTRIMSMRGAAGTSFVAMDDGYRLGTTVISDTDAVADKNGFLAVSDFNQAQRIKFFNNIYSATPSSSTPLRAALSKAGRYFANQARGQTGKLVSGQTTATPDPVQSSCQRNYTLLSTDGYWNTGDEDSSKGYGPYKLDGTTAVGQQDAAEVAPQQDGSVVRRVETYSVTSRYTETKSYQREATTDTTYKRITLSFARVPVSTEYKYTESLKVETLGKTRTQVYTHTEEVPYVATQTRTVTYDAAGAIISDVYNPTLPNYVAGTKTVGAETLVETRTPDYSVTATANQSATCTTKSTGRSRESCTSANGYTTNASGNITASSSVNFVTGYASYATPNVTSLAPTTGSTNAGVNTVTGSSSTTVAVSSTQTSVTNTTTGGSTSSLADVAEYYYVTPFRTSSTVNCLLTPKDSACSGSLTPVGIDTASYQHMTTFTLGLGVNGQLKYDPDYLSKDTGDFADLSLPADPNQPNGPRKAVWPAAYNPSNIDSDVAGKIDDLWHAAVNGRGQYYSASTPESMAASIRDVLNGLRKVSGYGGSAAASSLRPVLGTDLVYLASFMHTQDDWWGDLVAKVLKENANKEVVPVEEKWSAGAALTERDYTTRTIYYSGIEPGATGRTLRNFNYTNLNADGYGGLFTSVCSKSPMPSQCSTLSDTLKTVANSGTNVVDFLRGDRTNEATTAKPANAFRQRTSVLGDIVNASPVFVGPPPFLYVDEGYSQYKTDQASRTKVVYAAANDGMLHAFRADAAGGGAELWAFVPTAVLPNLYRLVDTHYGASHQYYVDGSPMVGDVYDTATSTWRTILVGGLNKGGKSYYALDITNPTSPKLLWEVNNGTAGFANLGYSYGNPVITKVKNPTDSTKWVWAVAFASGYNNTEGGGDGNGSLFVVNAMTGALLRKIDTTYTNSRGVVTNIGTVDAPSGLAKVNAWITSENNNQAERFYAGDLLGNLWRFDVNGSVAPNFSALRLAQLQSTSASTDAQPIQVRPELVEVTDAGVKYPVVLVGTGRYLGAGDLTAPDGSTASKQSIYAIKDTLGNTGWGPIRGNELLVSQSLVTDATGLKRTIASPKQKVDWASKIGWTVTLPTNSERVAIDMNLQLDTLGVISYVPVGTACSPSGSSWLYFLSVKDGAAATAETAVGTLIPGLGTGITWFDMGNGASTVLVPDDKLSVHSRVPPTDPTGTTGKVKRVSWRELVN
ncbi:MAG: hypothetical protein RI907_856 [Pseudomonadota bacterium]